MENIVILCTCKTAGPIWDFEITITETMNPIIYQYIVSELVRTVEMLNKLR